MKNTNLISLFSTLFILFLLIGCSPDASNEQQIDTVDLTETVDFSIDTSSANAMRNGSGVVDAKITFHPHVKESRKQKVRDEYIELDILISWSPCPNDPFSDIWIVNCMHCERDTDLPIKTDDCEDEEDACDVARAAIFEPCKK